ncbi:Endoglucanase [Hortaea werneckii]|uniref:Endoglucanase EG-II n=1 Tax=Hortaea werneckii TaxID=91943 RepID=A0A3M7DJR3_HORWE|nr:Endoglucanase [Hortaea werneckii]KAI7556814.1 Endoglucanase [Hortaea werneckii]KAI7602128.1 Endoglucanase [Hortaea werneckii]KAI7604269.1 Endoglucanase [Hortaea werneckii]KAI7644501.1 Endoglucanase [Hortaea werneckii]
MKASLYSVAAAAGTAAAQQSAWGRCGGKGWDGPTQCVDGWTCHSYNEYYSQCIEGSGSAAASTGTGVSSPSSNGTSSVPAVTSAPVNVTSAASSATSAAAGGDDEDEACETTITLTSSSLPSSSAGAPNFYTGPASSASAPASTSAKVASSSAAGFTSSAVTSSAPVASSSSTAAASSSQVASSAAVSTSGNAATTSSSSSSSSGTVKYAGVNIAGLDFGCSTDGTCTVSGVTDPGDDGISQMKHFVNDDGLNAFRLPVGWQYLVNDNLGGTLDSSNFGTYDNLMQGCLDIAELCILDVHNYARWNGQIIGQGGPTNEEFASLWSQLATKYADNDKVVFGVMNEPHDVDIDSWADSVQAAVTAIRKAGATSQKILLPGNDWTHASMSVSDGSAAALNKITNEDGSTDNLIFDVHQYLDSDGSGTHTECTTSNADTFKSFGDWLRENNRQAMLTETGGGPNADSCLTNLCEQFEVLNNYSDVYLGWTGWAAGAFAPSYEISETPSGSPGSYTDQPLVKQCIVGKFTGSS